MKTHLDSHDREHGYPYPWTATTSGYIGQCVRPISLFRTDSNNADLAKRIYKYLRYTSSYILEGKSLLFFQKLARI